MGQLYLSNTTDEQSALLAAIQLASPGFVPFLDSETRQTIPARFALMAARYPRHLAVKGQSHSYTYAELDSTSNAIAASLLAEGHSHGSTVALFLEHDVQLIACLLGVLKAGAIYVPLDPTLAGTRNSVIVDDSLAT